MEVWNGEPFAFVAPVAYAAFVAGFAVGDTLGAAGERAVGSRLGYCRSLVDRRPFVVALVAAASIAAAYERSATVVGASTRSKLGVAVVPATVLAAIGCTGPDHIECILDLVKAGWVGVAFGFAALVAAVHKLDDTSHSIEDRIVEAVVGTVVETAEHRTVVELPAGVGLLH